MQNQGRHRRIRILVAAFATLAVVARFGIASAAPDPNAAHANSQWLASQLVGGELQGSLGGGPDYGLMIDALFAMTASGDHALAAPIVTVLDNDGGALNFFSDAGFLGAAGKDDRVGGATAKVLVAALVSGRDPHHFGGYDMVAETKAVITPSGPEKGRVRDFGPNTSINNADTFGQSLAVIGLAGVDENDPAVIAQLLRQQCSDGYFRVLYAYDPDPPNAPNDCDRGKQFEQSPADGDSTGIALSALLTAKGAGAAGLDDSIARAKSWLIAHQDASGGWGGGVGSEAPNSNSTGLIVQALAAAGGADNAVNRGRAYILSAQANATADGADHLRGDLGAIAYTPAEYVAARAGGIDSTDTWRRSGTQASLGLSQIPFSELVTGFVDVPTSTTTSTAPVTTTTLPTATTTTTTSVGTVASRQVTVESDGSGVTASAGELPRTGAGSRGPIAGGGALLLAGILLVEGARRPRRAHAERESCESTP